MYVHIKCPTSSPGSPRFSIWRRQERGLDRTPLAKTDWVPHESPPVRSLNLSLTFTQRLRVGFNFFGRIQKRIFDLRSYGFFTTKKTEDPKKDHLPWQRHVLVLLAGKKTDTHRGKDKKKKQHKLGMNIRNVYISVWNTNVSRIEYTP